MEQIPVLQFALGKFILIHYHLMGGRGEGGGGGGGGVKGLEDFGITCFSGGGGWEGGGSVVTDRESPLTVIFSDSSRIFLVFTSSVH